jgi:hypothetical protein
VTTDNQPTDPPFFPLVAQVIQANYAMTADVTNRLIESLEAQLAGAHARMDAVEDGVMRLISGNFMPTPNAIRDALHPSAEMIARYRRDGAS